MAQDSYKQHCRQEADTAGFAKKLAMSLQDFFLLHPDAHLNISLEGDLGAGKTTFARYLIQALGFSGRVKSPTYTLCEPYPLNISNLDHNKNTIITANHFDLYRMRDPLEWQEAGFAEHFDEVGFCLVEWPDKAAGTLPPFDINIQLSNGSDENAREISISAISQEGINILKPFISGANE